MQLDQKVLSYELSKKLVEKGIVLDTEFYWRVAKNFPAEDEVISSKRIVSRNINTSDKFFNFYPAPLLVEMLEVLPVYIQKEREKYFLMVTPTGGLLDYMVMYVHLRSFQPGIEKLFDPLRGEIIPAVAKTLLHLLENGHTTLEDINK